MAAAHLVNKESFENSLQKGKKDLFFRKVCILEKVKLNLKFTISKLFVGIFYYILIEGNVDGDWREAPQFAGPKNLTQEELGERTDLSKGYISQLERDLSSPSMETFLRF